MDLLFFQKKLADLTVTIVGVLLGGGLIVAFVEWQRHKWEQQLWERQQLRRSVIVLAMFIMVSTIVVCNVASSSPTLEPEPEITEPTATPTAEPTEAVEEQIEIIFTPTPEPTPTPTPLFRVGSTEVRAEDEMTMVYVPAGSFQMGSVDSDPNAKDDEKPQHLLTLPAFWMDQTEVTNLQYGRCVAAGVCSQSYYWNNPTYNQANYPVIGISWDNAADYCRWAGGRLPTEAEWEYAARGPAQSLFPWGNTFDSTRTNAIGSDDGYERTAPVGSFPAGASWVGALDMAGNVAEWMNDWYAADYYAGSPTEDPVGPETGVSKVLRGGSWGSAEHNIRATGRTNSGPGRHLDLIGFRCVVDAPE